jgi:hypothetical protein
MKPEQSHGSHYLMRPRPRDVAPAEPDDSPSAGRGPGGRFAHGNAIGSGARATHAVQGSLKAIASSQVSRSVGGQLAPAESRQLVAWAMSIYRKLRRDLGATSPLVQGPLLRFAVNSVLCNHLTARAAMVGFESEQGAKLLELAAKLEARSERAAIAAMALARVLPGKRSDSAADLAALMAEAAKPRERP